MTNRIEPAATDAVLVGRARAGDREAFGELVRRHQSAALRLAVVIVGSSEEARDVVQEAFVKAYRGLDRYRGDAPVRPWLLRIVANEAKNSRRGVDRRGRREARHASLALAPPPPPEELALRSSDARRVFDTLAALGRDDREVLVHRYLIGLTEAEAAAAIGVAVGTVKSRSARALARLRRALDEAEQQ